MRGNCKEDRLEHGRRIPSGQGQNGLCTNTPGLGSSHEQPLDTFPGQKAHPSLLPSLQRCSEGSGMLMEISGEAEGEVL